MKDMNKAKRTAMAKRHEQLTVACNGYSRRDEAQLKRVVERRNKERRSFKQTMCNDIDYMKEEF